ncbi:MAG: DUF4087 domain-containing protein [Pyrinomonadaceae bacterium]
MKNKRFYSVAIGCMLLATVAFAGGQSPKTTAAKVFETRCGWFSNPTPANAWLEDRNGEWIIATQGGHQAEGDWPTFKPRQWVGTNTGSYGYGCACVQMRADHKTREVFEIKSSYARPLSACRRDRSLKEPK